jgi:hypothetical protein
MLSSKKLAIRKEKYKKPKEPSVENRTECHEIEPSKIRAMPEEDNPSF